MKRTVILLFTVVFIFLSAASACAYQYTNYSVFSDHTRVMDDGDSAYLISFSGTALTVDSIVPEGGGAQLSLSYPVTTAGVFSGILVALCNDHSGDQLVVYTYDIACDALESFAVSRVYVRDDSDFYYDGSLYIIDSAGPSVIRRYSSGGRLISSCAFDNTVMGMANSGGVLYVVSNNTLFRISGSAKTAISGASIYSAPCFIDGSTLCDRQGRIYRLSGDHLQLSCTLDSSGDCSTAGILGGMLYYATDNIVYRYDPSGSPDAYLTLERAVIAVFVRDNSVCAVDSASCVYHIAPSEFISLHKTPAHTPAASDPSVPRSGANSSVIFSDAYTVSYDTMRINGIPSGTTFAQFKRNLIFDGYTVHLYRDGNAVRSGNVGTAMQAVFDGADGSYHFELSVIGDITGEGNMNTRDLTELMDYLVGSLQFDGVYYDAADLSRDGEVDALDLAILCRSISS